MKFKELVFAFDTERFHTFHKRQFEKSPLHPMVYMYIRVYLIHQNYVPPRLLMAGDTTNVSSDKLGHVNWRVMPAFFHHSTCALILKAFWQQIQFFFSSVAKQSSPCFGYNHIPFFLLL
jgi:hypothetical protein